MICYSYLATGNVTAPRTRVEISVACLDDIGTFLTNHVNSILDTAVRNDREHRRINHSDVLQAMHLEISVNYAVFNLLR